VHWLNSYKIRYRLLRIETLRAKEARTTLLAHILLNNINRDKTIMFVHHQGRA
jgi:hypothetical protein